MSITCVYVPLKKKEEERKKQRRDVERKQYKEIQSIIVIFKFLLR